MVLLASRSGYSRAERRTDAAIHLAGLAAVLVAVPALITAAALLDGDPAALVGVSVYGAALVAMILCSALYNLVPQRRWSGLLKRLDHSAIYLKIAGTYTPFTLMSGHGLWLLAGVWSAALAGVGIKLVSPDRFRRLALGLYLGIGWAGLLAGGTLLAALSGPVLALILAGGLLYTAGLAFFFLERLPFHYAIWHAFVLAASVAFYAAVTTQLMLTA